MFLVEPESGQQCLYGTTRALGDAIRRGELGPQARIFHRTADRWLPITVHPEYRRAEADWEQGSAKRMQGRRWTFFPELRGGQDPRLPDGGSEAEAPPVPILVPGNSEASWLGTAVRHLLQLARPGM